VCTTETSAGPVALWTLVRRVDIRRDHVFLSWARCDERGARSAEENLIGSGQRAAHFGRT
jgi:hypothetical protein